ncbi:hypothetical protein NG831_06375 [Xanthomonas sacchari]|uniref:hypothetical protein n=1 Tax=Xanthomonas sacchari TaxID=56458 RepID=UPI002253C311|nr:hypothetical protein [Xanthomonas sacchari]MCW0413510.1 hypothetical protein [Xanthomonas sacchari]UYK67785.1 hypothetical protein NG831_06375 [Xanthomonas sacchari]
MSWPYWLLGAVIVLLLCMAFRRKEVADHFAEFENAVSAQRYVKFQDERGFDCFMSYNPNSSTPWQVRCYRRKEGQQ